MPRFMIFLLLTSLTACAMPQPQATSPAPAVTSAATVTTVQTTSQKEGGFDNNVKPSQPAVAQAEATPTLEPQVAATVTATEVVPTPFAPFTVVEGRIQELYGAEYVPAQVVGVLPEQIRLERVETVTQLDHKGNEVGEMQVGYDTKGRVMLVKPAGESEWLVAPFGKGLNGTPRVFREDKLDEWRELSVVESYQVFQTTSEIASIAQIVDTELMNVPINGKLTSFSNVTDNNIEILPEYSRELYLKLLDTFAKAHYPIHRQFWREWGFSGTNGEELESYVASGMDGKNKPYWVPSRTSQGTEFTVLQAEGGRGSEIRPMTIVDKRGGFFLDYMSYVFISNEEMNTNVWARAWYEIITRDNVDTSNNSKTYLWIPKDAGLAVATMWGLQMDRNNRWVFILSDPATNTWGDPDFWAYFLGGEDGLPGEDDLRLVTAKYLHYFKLMELNINDDGPNAINTGYVCISPLIGCKDLLVDVREVVPVFQFRSR